MRTAYVVLRTEPRVAYVIPEVESFDNRELVHGKGFRCAGEDGKTLFICQAEDVHTVHVFVE